jgi:hypothetical protein
LRSLAEALLSQAGRPTALQSATAVPAAVTAKSDRASLDLQVPGRRPPAASSWGDGATGETEAAPEQHPGQPSTPAETPPDQPAEDQDGTRSGRLPCEACFADGYRQDDQAGSGQVLILAMAVAFGLLSSTSAAARAEAGRYERWRFLT